MSATSKLGRMLQRLRAEKKITQEQLADASGVSRTQIARLESGAQGKGQQSWRTITGLARAFGLSAEKFMAMLEAEPAKPAAKKKPTKKDGK
jgi:transcriptional regulator with XRE-family HTH domain